MNTRAYYETEIMKNIKDIPEKYLPEFFDIFKSLKDNINKKSNQNSGKLESTGLCGIWEDERDVDEIIAEMESGRDYFSNRDN